MTDKELRRLSRADLLEILTEMSQENDRLREELAAERQKNEEREIRIGEAGSIAEAALQLNDVFTAAQKAADQYLYNIRKRAGDEK